MVQTTSSYKKLTARLSEKEHDDLSACETVIRDGIKVFFEVGYALKRIRDGRLYRSKFGTFEEYIKQWDLSRSYAYEVIDASVVVEEMSGIPNIQRLPESVSQATALARVRDPDQRRDVWEAVVKNALAQDAPITANRVRQVAAKLDGQATNGAKKGEAKTSRSPHITTLKDDVKSILNDLDSCVSSRDWDKLEKLAEEMRKIFGIAKIPSEENL